MKYYTYIYFDPRKQGQYDYGNYCFNFEPIYVGKGYDKRCYTHLRRNDFSPFPNKIRKIIAEGYSPIIRKFKMFNTNEEACNFEVELISVIGRKDLDRGPLLNLTDGGEGSCGMIHSEETKMKIGKSNTGKIRSEEIKKQWSLTQTGMIHSEETKKKISESLMGHECSAETKEKIGIANSGRNNGMYGKKQTKHAKQLISESQLGEKNHMYGKHHTNETKQKLSIANSGANNARYGKKHTPEAKRILSEQKQGKNNHMYGKQTSDDVKAKISASLKGRKRIYREDGSYYLSKGDI